MRAFRLILAAPLLLLAAGPASAQAPAAITLTDPARADGQPATPQNGWTLRVGAARALTAHERRALVALARPCSSWADALRPLRPQSAQRLFERCVGQAMDEDFDDISVLAAEPTVLALAASAPSRDADILERAMDVELECVDWLAGAFGPLSQDRLRSEYSSWHVAQRKVQMMRRCLADRLAEAGIADAVAYRYSRAANAPRNH